MISITSDTKKYTVMLEPKVTVKDYLTNIIHTVDQFGDCKNKKRVSVDATFDFSCVDSKFHESMLRTILQYQPMPINTVETYVSKEIVVKVNGTRSEHVSMFESSFWNQTDSLIGRMFNIIGKIIRSIIK